MKPINDDDRLWTTLSVEELEKREEYVALEGGVCCWYIGGCCVDCCFHIHID